MKPPTGASGNPEGDSNRDRLLRSTQDRNSRSRTRTPLPSILQFRFEAECAGLAAEARINDIPVDRDPTGVPRISQNALNHWLIEGENRLSVSLGRLDPASALERYECEVLARDSAIGSASEERVVGYRWPGGASLPTWPGREVACLTFHAYLGAGRWRWLDAGSGPIAESDRLRLLARVAELHRATSARQLEVVLQQLTTQHQEMARAHGADPDAYRDRQSRTLEAYMSHDRFRLEPLELSRLKLEPRADGRLVFVTDQDGRAPVRGSAGAVAFQLPSVFSRLEEGWTLVR